MSEQESLDAQSFRMLRVGDIVGKMVDYDANGRSFEIPGIKQLRTMMGEGGEQFRKDLVSVKEDIKNSLKELSQDRNQFWHPEGTGKTPAETQKSFEEGMKGLSDEDLQKMKDKISSHIDRLKNLKYKDGDKERPLTEKQMKVLGITTNIESLTHINEELEKIQKIRKGELNPDEIKKDSDRYNRSKEIIDAKYEAEKRGKKLSPREEEERKQYAHVYDQDNHQKQREPDPPAPKSKNAPKAPDANPPKSKGSSWFAPLVGLIAGLKTLIDGGSPADAAKDAAEGAASSVPGVGGVLAPNANEKKVRDIADVLGMTYGVAGAIVCGPGGPGAAVGCGALGNIIGTLTTEEILRLHERHVMGHKDVEPSNLEKVFDAAVKYGKVKIDDLKTTLEEEVNKRRGKGEQIALLGNEHNEHASLNNVSNMSMSLDSKVLGLEDNKAYMSAVRKSALSYDIKSGLSDGAKEELDVVMRGLRKSEISGLQEVQAAHVIPKNVEASRSNNSTDVLQPR
ncbi:MAG: hypothetical protein AABY33_10085 [Pseudomonadota bacterium]